MKALLSYRFNAIIFIFLSIALLSSNANAQTVEPADPSLLELLGVPVEEDEDEYYYEDEGEGYDDFGPFFDLVADTVPDSVPEYIPLKLLPPTTLPVTAFMPVVFDYVEYTDTVAPLNPERYIETDNPAMNRMMQEGNRIRRYRQLKQRYMIDYAPQVRYNINTLPEPPKQYVATVDPSKSTITISEVLVNKDDLEAAAASLDVKPKNWLHTFNGLLQFSQAYVSPNWYQGGNNNVNMIANFRWNVKLNQKFHPNLMAEATTQYKLAISSAPQDSMRSYMISEDLFQFNGTFGVRAFKHWFYSMNTSFKTQFLKNYAPNTDKLRAAFMSPGELNFGVGTTYNFTNPKKTFKIDASISPLSYNMKICTHPGMKETSFGIREGRHTVSEVGSNAEVKMTWNILWNITYNSRFFLFTDYDYVQSDWENTINFSINRYLSTQIYVHMRYDSSTPRVDGSSWHKWQLKEILSFGFQYQFKTI